MGWSLSIRAVNFQIAILLPEVNVSLVLLIEILSLICEIAVPGLLKGVGTINREAAMIIAIDTIIKSFLFSLIKCFPLDKRKSRNIKSKEIPNAR